jgi:hypothetical protein
MNAVSNICRLSGFAARQLAIQTTLFFWRIPSDRLWRGCTGIGPVWLAAAGLCFRCCGSGRTVAILARSISSRLCHCRSFRTMVPLLGKSTYFSSRAISVGAAFPIASFHTIGQRRRPHSQRLINSREHSTGCQPSPASSIHAGRIIWRHPASRIGILLKKCSPCWLVPTGAFRVLLEEP